MFCSFAAMVLLGQAGAAVMPAADVTAQVIRSVAERAKAENIVDTPIRTVDAGGHHIGVALVYRPAATNIAGGAVHNEVTEIYHVLEGSATLVTGGTLVNPKVRENTPRRMALNGPGVSGTAIEGGESRSIGKGDIIIIPAGTPHAFPEIQEDITYTVVRVDPGQVMTLK